MTTKSEHDRWNDPYWTTVWPRRERLTSSVTARLLEHLAPAPGERILEIGSGGGLASIAIAAEVGATGSVVGADISEPLVELATRRAAAAPAANTTFVLADVQHDVLPGPPFTAATSQFGVMFFDEPERAFANIRTHVVPGGRLAFCCWQEVEKNPWFAGAAVAPFLPTPPPLAPGKRPTGPFSLADPDETARILEGAGWRDVSRHPYETVLTVEEDTLTDREQLTFQGVTDADISRAWTGVIAALAPLQRDDGRYDAPLAFQIFSARR